MRAGSQSGRDRIRVEESRGKDRLLFLLLALNLDLGPDGVVHPTVWSRQGKEGHESQVVVM